MAHVFINYSRQDQDFVQQLARDLQATGVEVWYDVANISAGSQWAGEITKAVSNADVFLNISTENSEKSAWVRQELELAERLHKLIIPLVVTAEPSAISLQLRQWIDFRQGYAQAFQTLLTSLPPSVKRNAPIAPEPPKSKGYVFISYSEKDSQFVDSLKTFLKERMYSYWDFRESNRDYNIRLFLELEETIRNAAATLSILSPDWKLSEWAPREYLFAKKIGVPVFLLMAREMEPTIITIDMPYIDFQDVEQGLTALDRELQRKGLI